MFIYGTIVQKLSKKIQKKTVHNVSVVTKSIIFTIITKLIIFSVKKIYTYE